MVDYGGLNDHLAPLPQMEVQASQAAPDFNADRQAEVDKGQGREERADEVSEEQKPLTWDTLCKACDAIDAQISSMVEQIAAGVEFEPGALADVARDRDVIAKMIKERADAQLWGGPALPVTVAPK